MADAMLESMLAAMRQAPQPVADRISCGPIGLAWLRHYIAPTGEAGVPMSGLPVCVDLEEHDQRIIVIGRDGKQLQVLFVVKPPVAFRFTLPPIGYASS